MSVSNQPTKADNRKGRAFSPPDSNGLAHELLIQQSHTRSKEYGIDPSMERAPEKDRLSKQQLQDRIQASQPFYDLVTQQMSTLYQILEGSGFSMAVADYEGYILHTIGDGPMMDQYKLRNCLPGFRWTEQDVGTCAIGLVLHSRTPIQLLGSEMYSLSAQHVTNSAAPVYDDKDQLLGVIALSGHTDQVHIHTLGMVILAAETIRSQVSELRKAAELALRNRYMTALLESDHRGVVALDRQGRIVQLNQKAKRLLGLDQIAEGRRFDTLVGSNLQLSTFLSQGAGFAEREVTFDSGSRDQTLISTLDPITMPDGETAGGLLLLMERQRVMKLVNEMAGSQARFTFDSILGNSAPLSDALKLARLAARGKASVLLYGETGTGKELFAQAIHNAGPRRDNPFVVINCGAIPKELLESELFGYTEGAFTGARRGGRPGKFELADGGTLFLDEIGDMPHNMQVKILRALQSGEIQRVGSRHSITVDLRIIVATHVDLEQAIAEGRFRQDLYYRISTLRIDIPPLRERQADVIHLANSFLERNRTELEKPELNFSPAALEMMANYPWPGNIRQLENSVERVVNIAQSKTILPEDFGLTLESGADVPIPEGKPVLWKDMERTLIIAQLDHCGGNISKAARRIGISRPTLYRKLRKYGLTQS